MTLFPALKRPGPYRLLQPICWTRAQGSAWMLEQVDGVDEPIWRELRGENLGEDDRQRIANRWLFLRFCRARE